MLVKTRREEENRQDALKRINSDKIAAANLLCEEKVEDVRALKMALQRQKEKEMEEAILKVGNQLIKAFPPHLQLQQERDKEIMEKQIEQEKRMAMELERMKLDSVRDEKMRQQIRENRCQLC